MRPTTKKSPRMLRTTPKRERPHYKRHTPRRRQAAERAEPASVPLFSLNAWDALALVLTARSMAYRGRRGR